jgi:small subunit ribosomal protein S20
LANTKSAIREIRVARARQERNKSARSEIKSVVRKAGESLSGEKEAATTAVKAAQSQLDKAVNRGNLHRNAAARRTSRLTKKLNQVITPKTD